MPLLLIPLLVLGVAALWAVLLPLSLVQRYRHGRLRRRPQRLAVRINAWLLLGSVPLLLLGAWISGYWVSGALLHAAGGLAVGIVLSAVGLGLTRFERTPKGLYYTPPAWLVLLLTVLVAARIVLGFWQVLQRWQTAQAQTSVLWGQVGLAHASLFAVGGLLLGYYLGYTWGLKRRLG